MDWRNFKEEKFLLALVLGLLALVVGAFCFFSWGRRVMESGGSCLNGKKRPFPGIFGEKNAAGAAKGEAEENAGQEEVRIMFLGDMMFDRWIRAMAQKKGNDYILEGAWEILKDNDLVVANLEGPITENGSVSLGTEAGRREHLIFTFDGSLAGTLKEYNIRLVNLGNNHILNFGAQGLAETKQFLGAAGVDYFGNPGNSLEGNYFVKEIEDMNLALVNYNGFATGGLKEALEDLGEVKGEADLVFVYAHWGREYAEQPDKKTRGTAYQLVEAGADLVVGSHPHVVGIKEVYMGKTIYYSLGNFVFDQYFSEQTQRGLAVRVVVNPKDKSLEFEELRVRMLKDGQTVFEMGEESN